MSPGEWLQLLLVLAGGGTLGAVFFGGLRATVAALPRVRRPALLFAASFAARAAVVLAGFYLLGGAVWYRYFVALAGFLLARTGIVLFTRAPAGDAQP